MCPKTRDVWPFVAAFASLLLAAVGPSPLRATIIEDTHLPAGSGLGSLVADPNVPGRLFTGTGAGSQLSNDGGSSWQPLWQGTGGLLVTVQAVDNFDSQILYAGPGPKTLQWSSQDGGASWQLFGRTCGFAAPDPEVRGGLVAVCGRRSLFVSHDAGLTWSLRGEIADAQTGENDSVYAMAVDPMNGKHLIAGLQRFDGSHHNLPAGILVSRDGGNHWQRASATYPEGDFVVEPGNGERVYATVPFENAAFLGASADGGLTWNDLESPVNAPPAHLLADPLSPGRLYLFGGRFPSAQSLARSDDHGEHWQVLAPPTAAGGTIRGAVIVRPAEEGAQGMLILATRDTDASQHLWASSDAGATWSPLPAPESARVLRTDLLVVNPGAGPGEAMPLVWTSQGLWRRRPTAEPWDLVRSGPLTAFARTSSEGGAPVLFVAAHREDAAVIERSSDLGITWFEVFRNPERTMTSLAADPADSQTLFAVQRQQLTDDPRQVLRSVDGGDTWQVVLDLPSRLLEVAVLPSSEVVAVAEDALWRSEDGGSTWTAAALPADIQSEYLQSRLDPATGTLWLGAEPVLFRTADAGQTFQEVAGNALPPWTYLAGADEGGVFLGTVGKVSVSYDLGATWETHQDGLPGVLVRDVAVDPLVPQRAWLGTAGAGLLRADLDADLGVDLAAGRFRATLTWTDFEGREGDGHGVQLTSKTAAFWFFGPDNYELLVKVLDGSTINDHHWLFLGSLTNVGFELRVTDSATATTRLYTNPTGSFASYGDIRAFPATSGGPGLP